MKLTDLDVRTSATVHERGAGTGHTENAVKILGPKGATSRGRTPPRAYQKRDQVAHHQGKTGKGFYKADGTLDGSGTKVVAISIPPAELVQLDEFCRRVQMSRSHMLRQAWKHFQQKILGDQTP